MVQAKIKYFDILWFHRWFALTMFAIVVVVVFVGSKMQQEIYKVDAEIYITPKPTTVTGDAGVSVADYDYRLLNNQIEILSSDMVATRAAEYISKKYGKTVPVSASMLQANLNTHKKDYTSVISLGLTGAVKPKTLQNMMALYLKAYQDTLEDINSNKSSREREFLDRQIEASQQELDKIGEKLQAFEAKNETYNIDIQTNQLLAVASRLDEQSKLLNAEIQAANKQIAIARKHLPTSPEYVNLMARIERDPEANDLRKQIISLESEKAEWSAKVTDSHPKMIAFDRELEHLKSLLDKRLRTFSEAFSQKLPDNAKDITTGSTLDFSLAGDIINGQIKLEAMKARASTLDAGQSEVMGMLRGVPKQALEYAALKNSFEMTQEKMRVLQKRLNEATLMEEVSKTFTKVEILKNPTLPGAPIRPNLSKNMTAAALLGLCLALFSIFIRASLDRTLRWPFQVSNMVADEEKSALITLPIPPARQAFTGMLEKSNFTVPEPFKRLIIHLENLSKTDNVRRIGILPVSAFAERGMTTVALSLYLTELSNKMVLIDTDYSKNSLSSLIASLRLPLSAAIQEGPGLSDYLSGQAEDFVDIIYPLGKTVYGSFIPAGDPVYDTGFQFSHRNLGQLEENLSPNYNFVLYSLPSIEESYDAIAVARSLDGVLLLAHPGRTSLDRIQQSIRELEAVDCRVLGILVQPLKK